MTISMGMATAKRSGAVWNQDFAARSGTCAVVADGIGGLPDGARVARLAAQTALRCIQRQDNGCHGRFEVAVQAALAAASGVDGIDSQGGTCLATVRVDQGSIRIGRLGDVRVTTLTGRGTAWELATYTRDDNDSLGRVRSWVGPSHCSRSIQSITPVSAEHDLIIAITTDGVHVPVGHKAIVSILSHCGSAQDAARRLVDEALMRGTHDDATALVIHRDAYVSYRDSSRTVPATSAH